MIKSNLSRIVGEKRLKIADMAKDLQLHRHTLDQLYHDRAIRFEKDVLDKLCKYLNCSLSDILEFVPDGNS